jgi:hypothetical protein
VSAYNTICNKKPFLNEEVSEFIKAEVFLVGEETGLPAIFNDKFCIPRFSSVLKKPFFIFFFQNPPAADFRMKIFRCS